MGLLGKFFKGSVRDRHGKEQRQRSENARAV